MRRGRGQYTKPEYALNLAEELIGLNRKAQAFIILSTVACKRRPWTKHLEMLMFKFVDLCVDLNKGKKAKDALHHYRNVCLTQQQPQPQSLEKVLNHFIKQSENQVEKAFAQAASEGKPQETSPLTSDVKLPESVAPWVRFLWETYRTVLEISRNNAKLDALYKETCKQAFDYCRKYKRANEFRRLADLLRVHLASIIKNNAQFYDNPESVMYHLEIRFGQLNTAVDLELWQEAYKSIEDIKASIFYTKNTQGGTIPKTMIANYYLQLSKLFMVSKNYTFHAYALAKYGELLSEIDEEQDHDQPGGTIYIHSNLSEEERKTLYSRVVLAALSIPVTSKHEDAFSFIGFDIQREKDARLASLLDFEVTTNRSDLIEELINDGIFSRTYSEIEELHNLLESKFNPYSFSKNFGKYLQFLESKENLKPYTETLLEVAFVKLVQQLSNLYKTFELSNLTKMLPQWDAQTIEKQLVNAIRTHIIECRIDHKQGILTFTTSSFDSEDMRYKLAEVTRNLRKCIVLIPGQDRKAINERKKALIQKISQEAEAERKSLPERKLIIERIKELREAQEQEARRLAEQAALDREQVEKVKEEERIRKKKEEREQQLKKKQELEEAAKAKQQLAEALKVIAVKTGAKPEDLLPEKEKEEKGKKKKEEKGKKKDKESAEAPKGDNILQPLLVGLLEQRKKQDAKYQDVATTMDHLVRARREEEIPLLKQLAETMAKESEEKWKENHAKTLQQQRETYEKSKETKNKLLKMIDARDAYKKQHDSKINSEYAAKVSERDAKVKVWREEQTGRWKEIEEKKKAEEEEQKKRQEEQEKKDQEEKRKKEEEARAEEKKKAAAEKEAASKRVVQPTPVPTTSNIGTAKSESANEWRSKKATPSFPEKVEPTTSAYVPSQRTGPITPSERPTNDTWKRNPSTAPTTERPTGEVWKRGPPRTSEPPTSNERPTTVDKQDTWKRQPRGNEPSGDRYQAPKGNESSGDRYQAPRGNESSGDRYQAPRGNEPSGDRYQAPRGNNESSGDRYQAPRGNEPSGDRYQASRGGQGDRYQAPRGGQGGQGSTQGGQASRQGGAQGGDKYQPPRTGSTQGGDKYQPPRGGSTGGAQGGDKYPPRGGPGSGSGVSGGPGGPGGPGGAQGEPRRRTSGAAPAAEKNQPQKTEKPAEKTQPKEDDGWTTVKKKKH